MIPQKLLASGLLGKSADGKRCPICYETRARRDAGRLTEREYRRKYDLCFLHFMGANIQAEHKKHSKEGTSCQGR